MRPEMGNSCRCAVLIPADVACLSSMLSTDRQMSPEIRPDKKPPAAKNYFRHLLLGNMPSALCKSAVGMEIAMGISMDMGMGWVWVWG